MKQSSKQLQWPHFLRNCERWHTLDVCYSFFWICTLKWKDYWNSFDSYLFLIEYLNSNLYYYYQTSTRWIVRAEDNHPADFLSLWRSYMGWTNYGNIMMETRKRNTKHKLRNILEKLNDQILFFFVVLVISSWRNRISPLNVQINNFFRKLGQNFWKFGNFKIIRFSKFWEFETRFLFSGFSLLLWIGAFLCFTAFLIRMFASHETDTDDLILGCVLVVVVVVTGGFMYFQEHKSQKVSIKYCTSCSYSEMMLLNLK